MERVLEPEWMDDADEARAYAAMDHREPNAAFIARLVELGAGGRVLDLGTGPGNIPLRILHGGLARRIVAVDAAWHMLALAHDQHIATPANGRLHLVQADVKRLPFADASFDTVISNTVLHHLPEPGLLLREAARVAHPGGCVLIRDLFRPHSPDELEQLVQRHAGDQAPEQQQLLRQSLHAALRPDELEELASRCGLSDTTIVVDTDRHMSLQRRRDVQ